MHLGQRCHDPKECKSRDSVTQVMTSTAGQLWLLHRMDGQIMSQNCQILASLTENLPRICLKIVPILHIHVLVKCVSQNDRPLSVVGLRRKRCPVTLTRTAWVQFLPAPMHETYLCCSAKSGLMKLACLSQNDAFRETILSLCWLRQRFDSNSWLKVHDSARICSYISINFKARMNFERLYLKMNRQINSIE